MRLGENDNILIDRLNAHDEQAFEEIFHKYYATLCFFARKFVKDEEVARDVVQEVFIRFYEKETHFENDIALKSFLYGCVQNRALNYIAQRDTRNAINQQLEPELYTENEYFHHQIEAEILEEIFTAIEELPEECRRIFKMSYMDHLNIKEITTTLNIAESTVKTQRQRAKKFLRERLRHLFPIVVFFFF